MKALVEIPGLLISLQNGKIMSIHIYMPTESILLSIPLPQIGQTKKKKLPQFAISTNKIYAGVHYFTRNRHKNIYREHFTPYLNRKFPIPCNIRFDFYTPKPLDSSNCSYMGKLIEDCMIKAGCIEDDSIEYVHDFTTRSHKGDNYVDITIWQSQKNS